MNSDSPRNSKTKASCTVAMEVKREEATSKDIRVSTTLDGILPSVPTTLKKDWSDKELLALMDIKLRIHEMKQNLEEANRILESLKNGDAGIDLGDADEMMEIPKEEAKPSTSKDN